MIKDNQTIATYNAKASEYEDLTYDFWERFRSPFLNKFIKQTKGKTILDVGSGPGRDGLLMQKQGVKVTCLDASIKMVEMSKSKGLESILSDFRKIPFQDSSFDGVWAYTSFLHVPKSELNQVLTEANRVLRNGGILGLGMIEGNDEGLMGKEKLTLPRWFSYYTQNELESALKRNGFKKIYFEKFKPNKRNYLNFMAIKV